jgi:hypothetical protein
MRVLVDTNILVRSVQRNHPLMRVARNALRTVYQQGNELYLTTQNMSAQCEKFLMEQSRKFLFLRGGPMKVGGKTGASGVEREGTGSAEGAA